MRARGLNATLAVVGMLSAALAAQQTRDVAKPTSGTASLSGIVVTDEATPRPVRRAVVVLYMPGEIRSQRMTSTDDTGRFAFAQLPAGNVVLAAGKAGYVIAYYGAKRAGSSFGVPIALVDGQRTPDVTLRLVRGAVIAGSVLNQGGRPMAGVTVRVQQVRTLPGGGRVLGASPLSGGGQPETVTQLAGGSATTDDRGAYRVFGLTAGQYVVSVQPQPPGLGLGLGELRAASAAELQWAERQVRGGSGGTSVANPTPPPVGPTLTYANVFYPGTADLAGASLVTLAAGQEKDGVDIRIQFVATARLEGAVADESGTPATGVTVLVVPRAIASEEMARTVELQAVGLTTGSGIARTGPDGRFSVPDVQPGDYAIQARTPGRPARADGTPATPAKWAMTDVVVDGRDIQNLALTLVPGLTVAGRLIFEGRTSPTPETPISLTMRAVGTSGATVTISVPAGPTFSAGGIVPGSYRVGATLAGWAIKSAMLGGRDVADVPFEVRAGVDLSGLVLTLTDIQADVTGVVYDGASRPTSDLAIVLFAADPAAWFQGSRRLRAPVRPASDGRFTFTGLPAGEYYLAALSDVDANDWYDPAFLEQVVPGAIKVVVAHGEKKTQDLKLSGR